MPEKSELKTERSIICGTDFSVMATEAADIAAAMARRLGIKPRSRPCGRIARRNCSRSEVRFCKDAVSWMSETQRLRDLGTRVEEKFLSGSAFDELVKATIQSKARLVVVGAVGHGLPRRLLLGSVAERTAEVSPVPTLVVRPDSTTRFMDSRRARAQDSCGIRFFRRQRCRFGLGESAEGDRQIRDHCPLHQLAPG